MVAKLLSRSPDRAAERHRGPATKALETLTALAYVASALLALLALLDGLPVLLVAALVLVALVYRARRASLAEAVRAEAALDREAAARRETAAELARTTREADDLRTEAELAERARSVAAANLRELIDHSLAFVFTHDLEGRVLSINPAGAAALRRTPRQLVGRRLAELVPAEHRRDLERYLDRVLGWGRAEGLLEVTTREGERRTLLYRNRLVDPEEGGSPYVLGHALDVTEQRRTQRELERRERMLRRFVHHTPVAVAMVDREMRYVAASQRWKRDHGLEGVAIEGRSHYEVLPQLEERWRDVHRRCLEGVVERSDEDPVPRPDGSLDWLRWEVRPWLDPDGEVGGLLLYSEVITEEKRMRDALERLAQHDHLTHLLGRHTFRSHLNRALAGARDHGAPFALLFLDLDDFKEVNDRHGHPAGDALLVTLADRLRCEVRPSDAIGRWGGDEFVVLLDGMDRPAAVAVAERIARCLSEPFSLAPGRVSVSASIGLVAVDGGRALDVDQLLAEADAAMYRAKSVARGGVVVAGAPALLPVPAERERREAHPEAGDRVGPKRLPPDRPARPSAVLGEGRHWHRA